MHSNGGDKPVRDMCVSGYGLYSQETLKVSYSDVGEGGVVAVNCEKTQFFMNTLYLIASNETLMSDRLYSIFCIISPYLSV